jgi:hypothetical protein
VTLSRDAIGSAAAASLANGWRGLRDQHFGIDALHQALAAHEAEDAETLKADRRSLVTATAAAGSRLVVKEVRKGGARRHLADLIRGAPALRAFRAGRRLLECGIGAARPLAALERRSLGVPVRSVLVSLDLRDEPTAQALLARDPTATRRVLSALCELLIALHRANVSHGDLRAQHVHVATAAGGSLRTRLIDLEAVRFRRRLSDEQRLASVGQLLGSIPEEAAPTDERRRAFQRYADTLPLALSSDEAYRRIVSHCKPSGES